MSNGKNRTIADLSNQLFEQMERLSSGDLKGEDLQVEIGRAKAMTEVSTAILNNCSLTIEALKWYDKRLDTTLRLPKQITGQTDGA